MGESSATAVRRAVDLESLVEAAVLAPSGDNTQPWRFVELDRDTGWILLAVDPLRDPSPMNAGQRMARIAVGAAAENVLRTAALNGIGATIESPAPDRLSLRIENPSHPSLRIDETIRKRCTNRRLYDGQPLAAGDLQEIDRSTPGIDGVSATWITERSIIERVAEIVAQADGMLFGNASLRHAFLENVRFDAGDLDPVEEGLSLGSLELKGAERTAFRMLPRFPNWLVQVMRVGNSIGKQSARLVRSASGLCIGSAPDDEPTTDFTVGRVMQRAWLALADKGLAVQPMMSLAVLANVQLHGSDELRSQFSGERIEALVAQLRDSTNGSGRPAFMLRFGHADPPTARTGRLPVGAVKTRTAS